MKIRKITFENHFLFGNLHLDFTNADGQTVDTIIIAGENGVGKSLLLNTLFKFFPFDIESVSEPRNEKFELEFEISDDEFEIIKNQHNIATYATDGIENNIFKIILDYNILTNTSRPKAILYFNVNNQPVSISGSSLFTAEWVKILRAIFSDVEINFTSQDIKNVTSRNVDIKEARSEKSNTNLATEITQLLIDVQSLDALEFTDWARANINKNIEEKRIDTRIKRFTNAFEYMFPTKRYKKIETIDNRKHVVFEENGIEMGINELSSGEKQIVFRGGFFLKNIGTTQGTLVFIDEPEISLHPIWQLKILNFFKKLFTNKDGIQTSQLILATHSPFIIHNSNRENDKVIVLQKNEEGKIIVLDEPKFMSWTPEKLVKEAFNVNYNITSDKTIVLLEGETDEKYFNKVLEVFGKENIELEFRWIGRLNEQGNAEYTGVKALDNAKNHYTSNPNMLKNKTILFYDSDTNKFEEDIQNLLIRRMIHKETNIIYKKGIENLLNLPKDFEEDEFINKKLIDDGYVRYEKSNLDKTKLCNHICDELEVENQKEILKNINEEIERLSNLI